MNRVLPVARRVPSASGSRMVALLGLVALLGSACAQSTVPSAPASTSAPAATAKPAAANPSPTSAAPAPQSSSSGQKIKVALGISVPVYSYTPIYVAKEKGFFDEQGLDVEINVFKSGTEQQQALLADAILIGSGGVTEPITLQAQGVDTAVFTFIQDALVYKIMAKPDIKTVDDLKGRTMAVSRAGALSEQIVKIALSKQGKDPNLVKYQQAGGSIQRFAALQAGAVDAAILDAPSNQLAQKEGYTMLVDVPKLLPGFPYEVGYAKKDAIAKNRDLFLRYTRGYIKAAQFLNDPKNKDEVIKIAAKFLDMKEEDSRLAYEDVIGYFPKDGMPTLEGLRVALDGVQKFGDIGGADKVKPEQLLYADLVDAAKKP